jgi:small subunit ribosomal protein S21
VLLRDNNVDQALRVLKKKMQREGVFREMKRRRFFEKPSERSNREKAEAARRARKPAIREGLIAPPKRRLFSRAPPRPYGSAILRPSGLRAQGSIRKCSLMWETQPESFSVEKEG